MTAREPKWQERLDGGLDADFSLCGVLVRLKVAREGDGWRWFIGSATDLVQEGHWFESREDAQRDVEACWREGVLSLMEPVESSVPEATWAAV